MRLVITHLYPDLMSTYGDRGNILALVRRWLQRCKSGSTTSPRR